MKGAATGHTDAQAERPDHAGQGEKPPAGAPAALWSLPLWDGGLRGERTQGARPSALATIVSHSPPSPAAGRWGEGRERPRGRS